jgi:hypothetical protein
MRSLTSLRENRAYSSENFRSPVQKDFCNKIGQFQTIRALSPREDAIGISADETPVIRRVGSIAHQPAGFANQTVTINHGDSIAPLLGVPVAQAAPRIIVTVTDTQTGPVAFQGQIQ